MTTPHFDLIPKFMNSGLSAAIALLCLLLLAQASLAAGPVNTATQPVGEVSLVLGKVYVEGANRPREIVKQGSKVNVSDSILTEANGHVHIRFVDDAYVSVRPGSRLEVVRYDYDPSKPEQSFVKLNLQEGVTRSISGDAAKSARQRFRLNTPIAAIGVRGTDFVVSATESTTRALVNEGIIVLAPYSSECSAASFGPCDSNGVELTDSSLQLIELDGSAPSPRLLAAPHEREPGALRDEVQLAISDANQEESEEAKEKTVATGIYLESITPTRLTREAQGLAPAVAANPPAPEFTPDTPLTSSELSSRQLVWGRWADDNLNLERITLPYSDVRAGREVAVGNQDYILLRDEEDGSRVDRGLGVVSFELNSAQAFYSSNSGIVAMQVDGGNLDIDFNRSEFATELNLSHSLTGNVDFIANGSVSEGGFFNSRDAAQRIAGTVSIDGSEAGYFFERQLLDGGIQGLTLWDAQ